jgi:hypothetical protein
VTDRTARPIISAMHDRIRGDRRRRLEIVRPDAGIPGGSPNTSLLATTETGGRGAGEGLPRVEPEPHGTRAPVRLAYGALCQADQADRLVTNLQTQQPRRRP